MIPDQPNDDHLNDPGFQSLLVECLEKLERGDSLDADHLLKANPEHAESLAAFLTDQAMLRRVASEVRDSQSGRFSRQPDAPIEETIDSNPKSNGFAAGDTIRYIGEYEILAEIARGGMGIVFKARQQKLKRIVALKMILSGKLADVADIERFHREARAAGQLKHPNIVSIHEIGEHEGHHYFTMDYIDGHSLSDEVRDESLPPRRAAELTMKVANAIEFAHQRGTLHRDLKPANILIDGENQPHVTDFGLAKVVGDDKTRSELTASGQILGTPSYMPPEQAAGKHSHIGPTSDIYSLGAVLYACLTGRAPFVADSPVDTLLQVVRNEPVYPRRLNSAIPRDLETICLKCLEKEPHKRYGKAALLADDLDRFLQGRNVTARPVGVVTRSLRWCRRNKSLAAASLVVLVLTLTLAIGAPIVAWRQANMRSAAESLASRNQSLADSNLRLANKERDARQQVDAAKSETEQELDRVERLLYASRINAAYRDYQSANMISAWRHLEQCQPRLRGWEFHFLESMFNSSLYSLPAHSKPVRCLEFSPVSDQLFSSSFGGTLACWDLTRKRKEYDVSPLEADDFVEVALNHDGTEALCWGGRMDTSVRVLAAETGIERLKLIGHEKRVNCAAISPDGKYIATGSSDHTVKIWDAQTGMELKQLSDATTEVFAIEFGPSNVLYAATWNAIIAWDLKTEQVKVQVETSPHMFPRLAVSSDGKLIATNHAGIVTLRDPRTLHETRTLQAAGNRVFDFALSSDDKLLATCDRNNVGSIKIWDVASGQQVGVVRGHDYLVSSVAFNHDGTRIATGGLGDNIKIWQLARSRTKANWKWHSDQAVSAIAFSPDGKFIASGSRDHTVKIWDAKSGDTISQASTSFLVGGVAWCSDSRHVASVSEDGIFGILESGDDETIFTHVLGPGGNVSVRLAGASDAPRLAVACGEHVYVFDCTTGRQALKLPGLGASTSCTALAISKNGQFVVCAHSKSVRVWDTIENELVCKFNRHEQTVGCVAISGDAKIVASGSENGTLKFWDLTSATEIFSTKAHSSSVNCMAFNVDNSRLATGGYDQLVKIWDVSTGLETLTLREHNQYVTSVAFNPVSQQLVSASGDGAIVFWNE